RPGIRKERGTHVGASRNSPSFASRAWRTCAAVALSGAGACFVFSAETLCFVMRYTLQGCARTRFRGKAQEDSGGSELISKEGRRYSGGVQRRKHAAGRTPPCPRRSCP